VKEKIVLLEDNKARRSVRQSVSTTNFFTSSHNPSSRKPLRIDNPSAPFGPQSGSLPCASITRSLTSVSFDKDLLMSELPVSSQKRTTYIPLESTQIANAGHKIHRQLRQVQILEGEEDLDSDDNL